MTSLSSARERQQREDFGLFRRKSRGVSGGTLLAILIVLVVILILVWWLTRKNRK